MRALAELGCRYLQLDDTSLAYLNDPAQRAELAARGEDADAPAPALHPPDQRGAGGRPAGHADHHAHVPGQLPLVSWAAEGGYDYVAEALFGELDVDGFFCEFDDERSGGFAPLRFVPPGKQVVLGLVTTKTGALEDADTLKRRIDEAARYVPLEQLCLSPQCGFSSTVEGNDADRRRAGGQAAAGRRGGGGRLGLTRRRCGRGGRDEGPAGVGGAAARPGARRRRRGGRGPGARPGCGAGVFARAAAERGARVTGHGPRTRPRWPPRPPRCRRAASWSVTRTTRPPGRSTWWSAVQLLAHVANPVAVLRAAGRVGGGGRVTVWGREQECDVRAFGEALAPWLPPRPPTGRPGPPPITEPARLRKLVELAGSAGRARWTRFGLPVRLPRRGRAARAAAGPGSGGPRRTGPGRAVRDAVLARLAAHRTPAGGYRLHNLFRVLLARRR